MKNEPVITAATVAAVITAILALLKAFGVPISDDQAVALVGVVGPVATLIAAVIARGRVTPVE